MKKCMAFIMSLILTLTMFSFPQSVRAKDASSQEIEDGIYLITSTLSRNLVLDVNGDSDQNMANIQINTDNYTDAQKFQVTKNTDGTYTLTGINSGKALDVAFGGKTAGTNVWQYQKNGTAAQSWTIKANSDGTYTLLSKCNGLALDVQNADARPGDNVQVWTSNGTAAQKFRFEKEGSMKTIEDGTYLIRSGVNSNFVVDVTAGAMTNGTNIQLYSFNNSNAQKYEITYLNNGYYKIVSTRSGKALDVTAGSASSGTNVQQYSRNGTAAQQWKIFPNDDGTYCLMCKCGGTFLDVFAGNAVNGQNVWVYRGNGSMAQMFSFEKTTKNSETPYDDYGKLQVSGSHLVGSSGQMVQLRGISTHGIAWYPQYVNEASLKTIRDSFKGNVIRLAMYTAEYNGYCTGGNTDYLEGVIDQGVQAAKDLGMYVIIDWHILSDSNPWTYESQAETFFAKMSAKYAGYGNVLYEICNEPNGGTSWSDIKSYAQKIIPVIRANDKDGIIIVGTPNWSQYVDQAADDPITGYSNIMYTLHFYAATHKDDLRNKLTSAVQKGLPVFVTEYGLCEASGQGSIDTASSNAWMNLLNQYGISSCAWNLSNKAETCALLNTSCSKTSDYSDSDLTDSGKWVVNMLRSR